MLNNVLNFFLPAYKLLKTALLYVHNHIIEVMSLQQVIYLASWYVCSFSHYLSFYSLNHLSFKFLTTLLLFLGLNLNFSVVNCMSIEDTKSSNSHFMVSFKDLSFALFASSFTLLL